MSKLKEEELLEWHRRIWQTRLSFGDRPLFEEEQAYQQIKEMIQSDAWRKVELALERNERLKAQIADYKYALSKIPEKPEVTEEFIEEKAIELNNEILLANYKESYYKMSKDFIRSLLKELI